MHLAARAVIPLSRGAHRSRASLAPFIHKAQKEIDMRARVAVIHISLCVCMYVHHYLFWPLSAHSHHTTTTTRHTRSNNRFSTPTPSRRRQRHQNARDCAECAGLLNGRVYIIYADASPGHNIQYIYTALYNIVIKARCIVRAQTQKTNSSAFLLKYIKLIFDKYFSS